MKDYTVPEWFRKVFLKEKGMGPTSLCMGCIYLFAVYLSVPALFLAGIIPIFSIRSNDIIPFSALYLYSIAYVIFHAGFRFL